MQIVRDLAQLTPERRGASAAIGNFDGVHLGHQAVIDLARQTAEETNVPLGVMTFEPHPRSYFSRDDKPFRLMSPLAKATRLGKLGVDLLFEIPFDAAIVALSPHEFAREIIVGRCGLSHVVTGSDFRFGKDRAGDSAMLIELGREMGFGVTIAPLVEKAGLEISSTAIRDALSAGEPREAAAMLGHWHRIEGPVIRGEQRGRDLGYPTANMSITGLHPPKFGVYAVKVDVLTGNHAGSYEGAASIGIRPMFGENLPNCETYLFDFDGDLYGETLSVALIDFLRPELKFTTVENLVQQMDRDCELARGILADA